MTSVAPRKTIGRSPRALWRWRSGWPRRWASVAERFCSPMAWPSGASLLIDLAERRFERFDERSSVLETKRHRWTDLQDVVVRPVRSNQHAAIAHAIHDERGLGGRRLERRPIAHQLDAQEESRTTDVTDHRESLRKPEQIGEHLVADTAGVVLKLGLTHDVEHRHPDRARHGVAAKGAEELHAVVERARDRARRRHSADRVSVAEGGAPDDDVGYDPLVFERPEARPHPSEPCLHFVGDADTARLAREAVDVAQIPARKHQLAADAWTRLGDESCQASIARLQ